MCVCVVCLCAILNFLAESSPTAPTARRKVVASSSARNLGPLVQESRFIYLYDSCISDIYAV